ncbi:MAG: ribokinase [Chloroflexota bacterium]
MMDSCRQIAPHNGSVIVFGSATMDLAGHGGRLPAPGETVLARKFVQSPGGKGANQAVAAARSGARTTFLGAIGTDDYGAQAEASLRQNGVDTQHVLRSDSGTGIALISVDREGANLITVIPRANNDLTPETVRRFRPLLRDASVLIMQLEIPVDAVQAMAVAGREEGLVVVLNPAPACQLSGTLLKHVDILVPNQHELGALVTSPTNDIELDARRLLKRGAGGVVVTLGAEGVLVVFDGGSWRVPGHRVPVIDTTGAGDALVGAMAGRVAHGDGLRQAVRFGNAAAALSVGIPGAQPSMPELAPILDLLRRT